MSLLALPTEVLARIVHSLGFDFFKKDLGRLTLCKKWHAIAQHEIQSHVTLGTKYIARLYRASTIKRRLRRMPEWAKIQSLRVSFNSQLCSEEEYYGDECDYAHEALHELGRYGDKWEKSEPVLKPLEKLALLKRLEVKLVIFDARRWKHHEPPGCALSACKAALELTQLSLPTLRELDLNISETAAFARTCPPTEDDHACVAINKLLLHFRNLHVVRLRLARICPKVLAERPVDGSSLALEKLCIQCDTGSERDAFCRSRECRDSHSSHLDDDELDDDLMDDFMFDDEFGPAVVHKAWEVEQLADNLAAVAKDFAPAMKALRTFRVVWPDMLSEQASKDGVCGESEVRMFARDCLTGNVRTLRKSEAWDAEGGIIEPAKVERELNRFMPPSDEYDSWGEPVDSDFEDEELEYEDDNDDEDDDDVEWEDGDDVEGEDEDLEGEDDRDDDPVDGDAVDEDDKPTDSVAKDLGSSSKEEA